MNYTLRQLEVFLAVINYKSFTRAADALHLTQPAVSIQFKSFVEQFNYPLVEFHGKEFELTEFGHYVLKEVNEVWDKLESLHALNQSAENELFGTLKIASVSTGKYIMPFLLTDFLKLHNSINLSLDVTNKQQVIEALSDNRIDFALVSVLPEKLDCFEEQLMPNELVLVANAQKAESITRLNLQTQNFLFREEGSATRMAMEKFLLTCDFSPRAQLTLTSNEAIKQSVIAGLGISVMPIIGIRSELKKGTLKIIEHPYLPIETTWRLIWLKRKSFSPIAKAYLEYFKSEKEMILKSFLND